MAGSSNTRVHKWLFTKQEILRDARTIKDERWSYEKELDYRQKMTRCIQEMVDQLNEQTKDKSQKVTQLCMCAASIHMNRFFYFHSFITFDYQDVAAACLFLAGKSEESPRKLDHIVHVWWAKKFPKYKRFPSNNSQIYTDAKAYIVQLENIVLQTIAFDLKIDLPHPIVLTLTSKNIGHVLNDHGNKKLTECAYFFATDVLCVTNWAIRYSALEIAVCCVDIVCHYGKHEIPKRPDGNPWYIGICETLSSEKLEDMQKEFLETYGQFKDKHALHKFGARSIAFPHSIEKSENIKNEGVLPPPPIPPVINKVNLNEYKERNKLTPIDPSEKPRKTPDTLSNIPIGLPPINLPGITPISNHDRSREEKKEEERRKEKERRKEEKRKEERSDDRRKEDERKRRDDDKRKREHSKSSNHHNNDEANPLKKFRTDIKQNFVPASNNYSTSNGHHKEYRSGQSLATIKAPLPPLSPPTGKYLHSPFNIPKSDTLEKEEGEL